MQAPQQKSKNLRYDVPHGKNEWPPTITNEERQAMKQSLGINDIRPDVPYTTGQIARVINRSVPTIRTYIELGHLRGVRLGGTGNYLVMGDELLAYLDRHGLMPTAHTPPTGDTTTSGLDLLKKIERAERKAKRSRA
jgi:excisionase family DNA binding protein